MVTLQSTDLESGTMQTTSGSEDPVWVYFHDAAGFVTEVALRLRALLGLRELVLPLSLLFTAVLPLSAR